jgi:uncharacterized protein
VALRQAPAIEAYGAGGFRIDGKRHEGSVLILDDQVRRWPVGSREALDEQSFAEVFAHRAAVEFILLGIGPEVLPPPKAAREACRVAGVGLEVMDTASAVRLYNVLASEGRRLAAALIAV